MTNIKNTILPSIFVEDLWLALLCLFKQKKLKNQDQQLEKLKFPKLLILIDILLPFCLRSGSMV